VSVERVVATRCVERCLVLAEVKPHREFVTAWTAALEGA